MIYSSPTSTISARSEVVTHFELSHDPRRHEFGRCFDLVFGADPVAVPDHEGKSVFAEHKLTSSLSPHDIMRSHA
jgi:hypothetical protein